MFFNKELVCEKCNAIVNKKSICTFDYSRQGRIKNETKIKVCQKCGIENIVAGLQKYSKSAVIIQPSSNYNAYAFYSFNELNEGSKHSINKSKEIEYNENIKSFLPQSNEKCKFCSDSAIYTWCPMDIYYDTPDSLDINLAIKEKCIYVCKDCLIKLFCNKIETENINFHAVYPIIDEAGFYTPWDF